MARFATIGEAQAACSALRAAGIEARLADENLIAVDWLYSQAVGSIKVLVPEEDLEQARGILWSAAAEPPLSDPESAKTAEKAAAPPPHSETCPECDRVLRPNSSRFRILVLTTACFAGLGGRSRVHRLGLTAAVRRCFAPFLTPITSRCMLHRWTRRPTIECSKRRSRSADTIEEPCPRCGSLEVYRINYRRLKAIPLLFNPAILVVFPVWLALPKRRCDTCGLAFR